jgi:hypothetical protein
VRELSRAGGRRKQKIFRALLRQLLRRDSGAEMCTTVFTDAPEQKPGEASGNQLDIFNGVALYVHILIMHLYTMYIILLLNFFFYFLIQSHRITTVFPSFRLPRGYTIKYNSKLKSLQDGRRHDQDAQDIPRAHRL